MSYTDKTLTCRECGCEFVFTAGEQQFHAERGFTNEPGRCPECRARRKAAGGFGGSRNSGPREYHVTTCAACGKEARVPFVPSGDRPVYCSECFQNMKPTKPRW